MLIVFAACAAALIWLGFTDARLGALGALAVALLLFARAINDTLR